MIPILYPSNETAFTSLGYGKLSDATECTVTEERNGKYTLELKYPVNGIHYSDIAIGRIVYAVPHDGSDPDGFRIYKISKPLSGIVTISAEHLSYQLSHIPVRPFTATTCPQAMTLLKTASMESNPFTFWTDKTTAATYNQTEPASIRSRLGGADGSILDVYGGEYEFVGYTVKLWQSRGSNRGVTLRYGKNITDINEEDNIESTYTGVVPYYKSSDGTVVMPDSPVESEYADKYPFRRTKVVDLSSKFTGTTAPTKDQLTAAGQSYIKANSVGVPSVSIKVEFEPLWQTEEYKDIAPLERVWLCDTVTVYFDKLGIETSAKVTKTVYNVLKDRYDSITLGDNTNTLASALTSTDSQLAKDRASLQASISNAGSAATAYTDDKLKKQKEALEKAIDAAEDRATKVANSATELAKEAQTTARSKIVTYYQADAPTSGMVKGDLWIDTDDNKLYRYDGSTWAAIQDKAISEAMTAAGTAQATADGKVVTYAQADAPASTGLTLGDLWIDTDDNNHMYRWDGSKWAEVRDGYIEEAKKEAEAYTDSKITEQDSKLTAAKEEITKQINASTTGYVVLQKDANGNTTELLLMDTADTATATKVWRWNQAGLAYSSTGINGTYTTAITASGHVVADFVDTGTLTATIIKAGILASIDDNKNFWLNIQDGSFQLGAIKSIGMSNQDLLINRILNVEYGVELWRQNENGEPYIDFHSEADSPSSTTKYDYAARLSCAKAGTLQMLGTDKGDGTGHYHARLEVGGLELYQSKSSANATTAGIPYIDFHLADTAADYSMRIAPESTDSCVIRSEGGYAAIINTKAATLTSASSRRIKTSIADISETDADKLLKLRPVSFEYIYAPGETYHGLIAEEVQDVLPELVTVPKGYDPDSTDTDPLKILRLSYTDFVPYLIKLCQTQQSEIDDLKTRVAKLEEAITKT